MEEKPEILSSPQVETEAPKQEKSKTMPIVIGLIVVLLIFVGAVYFLSSNTDTGKNNNSAVTTTKTDQEVNSTSDLDKVSKELDSEDLTTYESELNQNAQDAAAF